MNMVSIRNSLYNVIDKVINQGFYDCLPEFIETLNKHKVIFTNILENDVSNITDRNLILNSFKEPIQISGFPQKITLTQDFIQETLIISDLFKLNEMTAVELLLSGEAEMTSNPEMARGLIAILSYYSSQKTIVDSLKALLQSKSILSDDSAGAIEVLNFIHSYCDNLFENGLFSRLLNLLKTMNIKKEIDLLESQRALGTAKHRRQFYIIFTDIKETLAECVMLRSFKTPLNSNEMKLLIEFVREYYQDNDTLIKGDENVSAFIDKCFIYLLISLINSMNPTVDFSKDCFKHPFFTEDQFIKTIHELLQNNTESSTIKFKGYDPKSVVHNFDQVIYLAWNISLQKVSHLKQEKSISHPYQNATGFGDYEDFLECDVFNLDSCNIYECFTFMTSLVDFESFHEENIWIKSFHDLITDFIVYMPKVLKDLKTESLRSVSNEKYFSSLLELIGNLYGVPDKLCDPLNMACNEFLATLSLEYWSPQEIVSGSDIATLSVYEDEYENWIVKSNDSYRQATLFKFIRDCGDLFDHPKLFVTYIFMLKGLCNSARVASYIYSMLNSNQIGHQSTKLTWSWFSNSIYQHAKFLISNPPKAQMMDPLELDGLLVVLQLIKRVTNMNVKVCESMVCNDSLMLVQNLILLLSCGVPKPLKAELLNCLALFCQNTLVAKTIWQSLESNKVINTSPENSGCGIQMELCEIEPKLEEFYITRAFLNFLLAVTPHLVCDIALLDQSVLTYDRTNTSIISTATQYFVVENLTCVIQSVMETVFLKHPMRTYRNIEEKFAICESFLKLCCKCVELFLSQLGNTKGSKNKIAFCQHDPGFFIISQLLCESPFFKTVVSIIDSGFLQITESLNNITFGPKTFSRETVRLLENSICLAMDLISTVLKNESLLVELNSKFNSQNRNENFRFTLRFPRPRNFIPQELSQLLMTTSCTQLFLQNLIKYISIVDENEQIARKALLIFNSCVKLVQPHSNLMLMITNRNVTYVDILPLMVNCIDKFGDVNPIMFERMEREKISKLFFNDYEADSPRTLVLKALLNCLQQPTPNLGQYLMGFSCDSVFSVKRTSLQEAGVGDFPKTCLHSLLNLIQRLVSDMVSSPFFRDNCVTSESLLTLTVNMIDLSLSYRILYLLASNAHTSVAVLRFIRSNYQFIFNQIDLLAFNTIKLANVPELRAIIWNQKSWLLKIIAIEVRLCTAGQQRSYISKLLKLLFGEDLYVSNNNAFLTWCPDDNASCQGLIYQLLEDFEITEPEELNNLSMCQRLKPDILKEYLNECLEDTYIDIQLMNASKLKQMIFADINMTVDEEHIQVIQMEVDGICKFIDQYNANALWLQFGKTSAVEAWRQVVEVIMLSDCTGEDCVDVEIKRKKIFEILQLINEKILAPITPSCLITPFSRVCLILSAVLAGMFAHDYGNSSIMPHVMPDDEVENAEENRLESIDLESLYNQLRILIKLTTRCIMEINYKYQNNRIKFYGVLAYLLGIVLKIAPLKPHFSNLLNECYLIINNHSLLLEKISEKSLYSTVCCDCISGNIHLALSSLTVLDCIASVDQGNGGLIAYLKSHGYLNHFVDSLVRDCENIFINMKHAHDVNYLRDSHNLNDLFPYYLFLSRMSLLCKLASQPSGAKALVQCGALTSLSRSELFKIRPSIRDCSEMSSGDDNSEDIHSQYSNILSFTVQLANNILSTLGIDKSDAVREVLVFIGESIDSLCEPFHSSISSFSSSSLKEMIQISNLFVLLVPGILQSKSLIEVEYKYRTLEKIKTASSQMIALLLGWLNKPVHGESEMMQNFLQIQLMGNFLMIACGLVSPSSNEQRGPFFSSNIEDALGGKNNWNSAIRKITQIVISGNKPPMSLLIIILYKMQECYENILKKLACFLSSDYDISLKSDVRTLSTIEVETNLSRMSMDQLQNVWNSVFDIVSNRQFNGDPLNSVDFNNSMKNVSNTVLPETDLVKDLVIVYKRITNVLTSIIGSLESCCFLLWNHALAYKSSTSDVDSFASDVNLHPIQKLHKMQQFKMESEHPRNISANEDITVILSKCIDNDLLNSLQTILGNHLAGDESSAFSKVVIHRLIRMINLNC